MSPCQTKARLHTSIAEHDAVVVVFLLQFWSWMRAHHRRCEWHRGAGATVAFVDDAAAMCGIPEPVIPRHQCQPAASILIILIKRKGPVGVGGERRLPGGPDWAACKAGAKRWEAFALPVAGIVTRLEKLNEAFWLPH
jgi:hypothetical protein